MPQPIEFYFTEVSPPARCVWMVLEELGLQYNEHIINLFIGEHKTEEYKQINFRQKVPAIKDGDLALAESRAIATYLVNEYGLHAGKQHLYPTEPKLRAKVDQHLYIGVDTFNEILSYLNVPAVLWKNELTKTENIHRVKAALQQVEEMLEDKPFTVAHHMTLADIFYYVTIQALKISSFVGYTEYPKITQWMKTMSELPYHKKICEEQLIKLRGIYQQKLERNSS